MTVLHTIQDAPTPQVSPDSVLAQPDSVANSIVGLLQQQADTAGGAFQDFANDISETGNLLLTGEWSRLWEVMAGGLVTKAADVIPNLVGAVFVFVIFYGAYRIAHTVTNRVLTRSRRVDSGLHNLIIKTFRIVAWFFIIVMVLSQFGVNITAILAGLGIAGIAIGLAAKDTIENFISGITILVDRPFSVGDQVSVDQTYGTVENITLRSTRVRTRDHRIMVMPNVMMINQKIYNHAQKPYLRVEIPFGIAYKEYPHKARAALLQIIDGDERLRTDKPAEVVVTGLNDSSIDMALWLYVGNSGLEQPLRWEYTEKIRETLREAGIEIPFPHLQLFVDEAKALENPIKIKNVDNDDA